jgi:uncharacterized membrane protein (DUF373 family)
VATNCHCASRWRPSAALLRSKFANHWRRFDSLAFFDQVIDVLFKLLIFFVVLVLAMGLIKMFVKVWSVMAQRELKDAFGFLVTNLLTFFIILELFKSLVEYFREHRLKLTFIVDATLVFILREVMIGLYHHQTSPLQISALAALALVLGCLRTLANVYSPMERKIVEGFHAEAEPGAAKERDGARSSSRSVQPAPAR